jgi:hypothetical protein
MREVRRGRERGRVRRAVAIGGTSAVVALSVGGLGAPGHASSRNPFHLDRARPAPVAGPARSTGAARQLRRRGYLVPHPAAFARAKGLADRAIPKAPAAPGQAPADSAPVLQRSWNGVFDTSGSPSDSNGAIGPDRYVELINTKFAIYTRTSNSPLSTGKLSTLAGLSSPDNFFLTDPEVIWDPDTQRFYYVVLDADVAYRAITNGFDFLFGFSKTSSPSSPGDWCTYTVSAGYDDPPSFSAVLPDQPHLGDSQDFVFWGVNDFDLGRRSQPYIGSDLDWVTKPPPGPDCPAPGDFQLGVAADLHNPDGSRAWTPVGVNQTDSDPTGWAVASKPLMTAHASGSFVSLFSVTDASDGSAVVAQAGSVPVSSYRIPPNAPEAGISALLDTGDGRLNWAVSAVDPAHGGVAAIWTVHTVAGGAGSAIRWYEIEPTGPSLLQAGVVSDPTLFAFNGAIAPDRLVLPAVPPAAPVAAFGDTMVLGFDTSSEATDETIYMVDKTAADPQSAWTFVVQSSGPNVDSSCFAGKRLSSCRWGDFMSAAPDPGADPTQLHGAVWLTSMWNVATRGGKKLKRTDWRTWNWEAAQAS